MDALAGRRAALITRSDQERAALAATFGGLERTLALADVGITTARRLHRHRVLVGAATVGLVLAPLAARTWIRRTLWVLPLAIEGYRLVKALGAARRPTRAA